MFSDTIECYYLHFNAIESAAVISTFVLSANIKSGFFSLKREKNLSTCLTFPFHVFISLHVGISLAEIQNKSVRSLVQSQSRVSVGMN